MEQQKCSAEPGLNIKKLEPDLNGKPFDGFIKTAFNSDRLPHELVTLKNVFFPSWDNKPPNIPPAIKLDGTSILTHQNCSAIIAKPGAGKSSIMEAILASFLNTEIDALGFEVNRECKGVIYVDTERTETDVWNCFYRMARRARITEGQEIKGVVIAGFRSVPRLKERKAKIEKLISENPCSLLLIDGAGDLVSDTNDLDQAIECRTWIRELTVKYNLSVLVTLHPNPGSDKPRGHQGSEICREAESVLIIKQDGDIRLITSDFEHGKNRNNPKLTTAFNWSDNEMMFVSADLEELQENKQSSKDAGDRTKCLDILNQVLPFGESKTFTELVDEIIESEACSKATAKRRISQSIKYNLIKTGDDKRYRRI